MAGTTVTSRTPVSTNVYLMSGDGRGDVYQPMLERAIEPQRHHHDANIDDADAAADVPPVTAQRWAKCET